MSDDYLYSFTPGRSAQSLEVYGRAVTCRFESFVASIALIVDHGVGYAPNGACTACFDPPSLDPSRLTLLQPPRRGRQFGTLLSVNSPPPPTTDQKKRKVVRLLQTPAASTQSYTVTFAPGPIGLQLEPSGASQCRVQGVLPNSQAAHCREVNIGDQVTHVQGIAIDSYSHAIRLLKESSDEARELVLQKPRPGTVVKQAVVDLQELTGSPLPSPEFARPFVIPKSAFKQSKQNDSQLQAEKEKLEEELQSVSKSLKRTQEQLQQARSSRESQQGEHQSEILQLVDQKKILDQQVQGLTEQLRAKQQEIVNSKVLVEQGAAQSSQLQRELQRLQTTKTQLEREYAALEEELSQLQVSYERLQTQREQEGNQVVQQLQEENSNYQKQLEEQASRLDNLSDLLRVKEEELQSVSRDLQQARAQLQANDASEQLTGLQKELEEHYHQVQHWKQQYESLQSQMETNAKEKLKQQEKLRMDSDKRLTTLQNELDEAQASRKLLTNMLQEREARLDALETTVEEQNAQLDRFGDAADANEIHSKFVEARAQLTEYRAKAKLYESTQATTQHEVGMLRSDVARLTEQLDSARTERDHLDVTLASKKSELSQNESVLEDVTRQLKEQSTELDQTRRSKQVLQQQYTELASRLAELSSRSSDDTAALTKDLLESHEEMAVLQKRNNEAEKLLRSLRRVASEAETRAKSLWNDLRAERESHQKEIDDHQRLTDQLDDQVRALNQELEVLRAKRSIEIGTAHSADVERESLVQKITVLEKELVKANHQVRSTESKYSESLKSMEQQLEVYRSLSDDLRVELSSTQSAYQESERKIVEIQDSLHRLSSVKDLTDQSVADSKAAYYLEKEDLHGKIRKLERDLQDSSSKVDHLNNELRRSASEVDSAIERNHNTKREYETRVRTLMEKNSVLVRELEIHKSDADGKYKKMLERERKATASLKDARSQLSDMTSERDRLVAEKGQLILSLREAEEGLEAVRLQREHPTDESFNEGIDEEFIDLSRTTLKRKCTTLKENLQMAEERAMNAVTNVARKVNHIKRLEDDLAMLSREIDQLIDSNENYEKRMEGLLAENQSLRSTATKLEQNLWESQQGLQQAAARLEVEESRRSTLESQVRDLTNSLTESSQCNKLELASRSQEVDELSQALNEQRKLVDDLRIELASKEEELAILSSKHDRVVSELSNTQSQLELSQTQLEKAERDRDLVISDHDHLKSRLESQKAGFEDENTKMASRLLDCQRRLEEATFMLEQEKAKTQDLDNQASEQSRRLNDETEKRERLSEELLQLQDLLQTRTEALETSQLSESELRATVDTLNSKMEALAGSLKSFEASVESSGQVHDDHVAELVQKYQRVDAERKALSDQLSSLNLELREARKHVAETTARNDSLQKKVVSLKEVAEDAMAKLKDTKEQLDASTTTSKQLESDIDSRQMEINHLKASLKMQNAAVARLRTEQATLKDAALLAENQTSVVQRDNDECDRLRHELQTLQSKFDSISEVYKTQQQVLSLSHTLENQLIRFIEEILSWADQSYKDLASVSKRVKDISDSLSRSEASDNGLFSELIACLQDIADVVPAAFSDLSEKRKQLNAWKKRRALRVPDEVSSAPRTPGQESPSVKDAFNKMKRLFDDEVLSPSKAGSSSVAGKLDVEYMEKVIHSLELQIDGLLSDLKCANEALRSKDELFADLELLVAHHESEREHLEKKLESSSKKAKSLEERLQALSMVHPAADHVVVSQEARKAAVLLAIRAGRRRENTMKASALRQWYSEARVAAAVSDQNVVAAQLSQELSVTHQKLAMLKSHLTKKGRRVHDATLASISEGYETS